MTTHNVRSNRAYPNDALRRRVSELKVAKAGRSKDAVAARRERFVEAMLANGENQTKAAEAVGYKPGNAARIAGTRLMKDTAIRRMLAASRAEALSAAKVEAGEVILSAARQIRFDPRKLVNGRGKPKALRQLDEDTALALSSVEVDGLKVRVDRGGAQERLMKHLGLFEKDNQQKPAGVVVHKPGVRTVVFVEPLTDTRKG
jgi:phage terminase small subunit